MKVKKRGDAAKLRIYIRHLQQSRICVTENDEEKLMSKM